MKLETAKQPYWTVTETAAPSDPASGDQAFFVDPTDHLLKRIDSSGTTTTVGGLSVTDGTTTVDDVTEIDFLSGATISDAGSGVVDVTISGGGGGGSFVGCRVFNSGTQNVSTSSDTAVTWDSEVFDTNSIHSVSANTSHFTVPSGKGGKWVFHAEIAVPSGTGQVLVWVKVNGSSDLLPKTRKWGNSGGITHLTWEAVATLSAGDYGEVYFRQASGSTMAIGSATTDAQNYCDVYFVGA